MSDNTSEFQERQAEIDAGEQQKYSKVPKHLLPHVYKKGQSGNPKGRPPGISLKEYVKLKFLAMSDEEREEYLDGVDKKILWEMAEGKAEVKATLDAKIEHTVAIDPKAESLIDEIIS
jgi:hypothetical protein